MNPTNITTTATATTATATATSGISSILQSRQRKYLRNAPKPEVWSDVRDTVLDQWGTDAKEILEETLQLIRLSNPMEKRSGPGRKSNAEHAINFYEYLLQEIPSYQQRKVEVTTKCIQYDGTKQQSEIARDEDCNEDTTKASENHNEVPLEETISTSVNTQQSHPTLNVQHNSHCEVCDGGGNLLMCSTCRLVFHLSCVRPAMEEMPIGPWMCSYCIMSQGLPVISKQRRLAAAAVRLMARIRKRKIRERVEREGDWKGGESDEKDNVSVLLEEKEEAKVDTVQSAPPKNDCSEQKEVVIENSNIGIKTLKNEMKKIIPAHADSDSTTLDKTTKLETDDATVSGANTPQPSNVNPNTKIDDKTAKLSVTGTSVDVNTTERNEKTENGTEGRTSPRRNRRHPTLYNPQAGPASRWQTDELREWKMSHDSTTNIASAESAGIEACKDSSDFTGTAVLSGRRAAVNDESTIWCNFCKDDPEIQICVFCACRVCFGKHNDKQLLICDQCDEEYHTFCLDPPLEDVPTSKEWFCPSCIQACKKTEISRSRRELVRSPTDRAKSKLDSTAAVSIKRSMRVSSQEKKKLTDEAKKPIIVEPPIVRCVKIEPVTEVATAPRKRGRPPKHPLSAESDLPRKRGRPPKSETCSSRSQSEPPRKRGRPPSAATLAKRAKAEADVRKPTRSSNESKEITKSNASKRGGEHMSEAAVRLALAAAAAASAKPNAPVHISRSGRAVKPIQPYDEIGHGMQQLQTSRLMEHLHTSDQTALESVDSRTSSFGELSELEGGIHCASTPGLQPVTSAAAMSGSSSQVDGTLASLKLPPGHVSTYPSVTAGTTLKMADFPGLHSLASSPYRNQSMKAESVNSVGAVSVASQSAQHFANRDDPSKQPRRKPGARECMQISRRFGVKEIPEKYIEILTDYCHRGKVEHLIRMRERLDEHSRFLEAQLAGLEALVLERGESDVVVPLAPPSPSRGQD